MMSEINKRIVKIVVSALVLMNVSLTAGIEEPNLTDFYHYLETDADAQAAQAGQIMFEHIERKYGAEPGFEALKSKMKAVDFLAGQMITQLRKATGRQMFAVADEVFEEKSGQRSDSLSVAPAKNFYETSREIFLKPVSIDELDSEEKEFLVRFYDLKLRILTSEIARAGQALAIAEPSFKGTYDYVLVLPLIHASETKPVNINVLPKWMRQSNQLKIFSDSCLLHYGFAYHAHAFAREAARLAQQDFSEKSFYVSAAGKCAAQAPHVAVDCLKRAIHTIDERKVDERMILRFDIVQIWLNSDNFSLAAGEAKSIADDFGNHKMAGNAVWLQFYALARANSAETILVNIDAAIDDPRCTNYRPKLMYIKWWALRRQKNNTAQLAALEHKLITDYGDNAMVAPIMLSQATDLLAGQDYTGAFVILEQIQEKFPSTSAAAQAKKMAEKLKVIEETK